ncbi:MAG: SDR family NAD(P)-dependent oxidoreductase [Cyanobacteria bacterium J06627_15]
MSQHVLITGASQGAGKATALLFAENGWDVMLTARSPEPLEAVAGQIWAMGQQPWWSLQMWAAPSRLPPWWRNRSTPLAKLTGWSTTRAFA